MDTTEIQGMMVEALDSLRALGDVNAKADELLATQIEQVWNEQGELRDELHALANRVESLTRLHVVGGDAA